MTYFYLVESRERLGTFALLDAVASIIEPDSDHKPSTDTLMHLGTQNITHSRLGLSITEGVE